MEFFLFFLIMEEPFPTNEHELVSQYIFLNIIIKIWDLQALIGGLGIPIR